MLSAKFSIRNDMIQYLTALVNGMRKYLSLKFLGKSFTYSLKHRTIQSYTLPIKFFVLVINTMLGEEDILEIYRQRDVLRKRL